MEISLDLLVLMYVDVNSVRVLHGFKHDRIRIYPDLMDLMRIE